jgi:hypothetical protein
MSVFLSSPPQASSNARSIFLRLNKVIIKKSNSQEVFTGLLEVENKMLVGRLTRHKITLFRSLRNCLFCFFSVTYQLNSKFKPLVHFIEFVARHRDRFFTSKFSL